MSDTTAVVPAEPVPEQPETMTQFVALSPDEMKAAHGGMLEWAQSKIREMKAEVKEFQEEVDLAKQNKWRSGGFERHRKIAERRLNFYRKVAEALNAGYIVVPNFAMTAFAIRTTARKPQGGTEVSKWAHDHSDFIQQPQELPPGEGRYVNNVPSKERWQRAAVDEKGNAITNYFARPDEFVDMVFPLAVAKPQIMGATAHAMSFRIFDEVGMTEEWQGGRRGDPIVIGRIRNPWSGHPHMTFFIGWYMDTRRV